MNIKASLTNLLHILFHWYHLPLLGTRVSGTAPLESILKEHPAYIARTVKIQLYKVSVKQSLAP